MSEKATTAAEFKAKYGRRRLTPETAGISVLYDAIYRRMRANEQKPETSLYPSFAPFMSKIKTPEGYSAYNLYANLSAWLRTEEVSAITVRNSLTTEIAFYYEITSAALAAENLRRAIGDNGNTTTALWLQTLSIDGYTPQSDNRTVPENRRKNIENGLNFLLCHNTLIRMIADRVQTPELEAYCVDMKTTEARLLRLNEALSALREDITLYRLDKDKAEELTAGEVLENLTRYTPEYLRETLKAFDPVPLDSTPIPEHNIRMAQGILDNEIIGKGRNLWYILMPNLRYRGAGAK